MLTLASDWVWDFWIADDGDEFHAYFLHAPRSLGEEGKRHRNALVGHAISTDLITWSIDADVLGPGKPGGFDETAAWTGSVVRGDDGVWRMFYTGASFAHGWPLFTNTQAIGLATSADLYRWERRSEPEVVADPRWYEKLGTSTWPEEAWRDPWVYRGLDGEWNMLITARSNVGPEDERGVIGHAVSSDLEDWTVTAPMTSPGAGFQHMEVPQYIVSDEGRPWILFSCPTDALSLSAQAQGATGGVWVISADEPHGSHLIAPQTYYSGRVVRDRGGALNLMVVLNLDSAGEFLGQISDPIPIRFDNEGVPYLQDSSGLPL